MAEKTVSGDEVIACDLDSADEKSTLVQDGKL